MNQANLPNDINERAIAYVRYIAQLEAERDTLLAALKLAIELLNIKAEQL